MPSYTVPRVEIEQVFTATPVFANNPLSAFVFGPNFTVIDPTDSADRTASTGLIDDDLISLATTSPNWPIHSATPTAEVDLTTTEIALYGADVLAVYFSSSVGADGTNPGSGAEDINPVFVTGLAGPYFSNRVQFTNAVLKASVSPSGVPIARSSYFASRDVQVGDYIELTGTDGGGGAEVITAKILDVLQDATTGKYNILVTDNHVWDVAAGASTVYLDPALGVTARLLLKKDWVELPSATIASVDADGPTFAATGTFLVTDPGCVTSGGVLVDLQVTAPTYTNGTAPTSGTAYIGYRVLRTDNATAIASLSDPTDVEATLGAVTPKNPLAQGVYDALLNAAGTAVYYMGVPTNDLSGYNAVLNYASRSTATLYGLVPLSKDPTVIAAVLSHVDTMSTAAQAAWRKAWICKDLIPSAVYPLYDVAEPGVIWKTSAAGIITDPQDTDLTKRFFTLVAASGSVVADLITDGVRAGDTARVYYTSSAKTTHSATVTTYYTDITIAEVRSNTEILLEDETTATTATDPAAIKIFQVFSKDEQITNLGGSLENDRRVNAVFPDYCKTNGVTKDGFYLAAACAGLRAASVPHQPLTNVEILGFDDVSKTLVDFSPVQLDALAEYGVWIVAQDTIGGTPYVRHQLTTDGLSSAGYDPKFNEDSVTTNVDSVSYVLQRALRPYIGRYNLNPTTLALVGATVRRVLDSYKVSSATESAGPQILSYNITKMEANTTFRDRIDIEVTVEFPYPLNRITIKLVV